VKRALAAVLVSALMLVMMATPALAIVHSSVPADECASASVAGGERAAGTVFSKNPQFQSPPVGNAQGQLESNAIGNC
jgi:hypothetical protein